MFSPLDNSIGFAHKTLCLNWPIYSKVQRTLDNFWLPSPFDHTEQLRELLAGLLIAETSSSNSSFEGIQPKKIQSIERHERPLPDDTDCLIAYAVSHKGDVLAAHDLCADLEEKTVDQDGGSRTSGRAMAKAGKFPLAQLLGHLPTVEKDDMDINCKCWTLAIYIQDLLWYFSHQKLPGHCQSPS